MTGSDRVYIQSVSLLVLWPLQKSAKIAPCWLLHPFCSCIVTIDREISQETSNNTQQSCYCARICEDYDSRSKECLDFSSKGEKMWTRTIGKNGWGVKSCVCMAFTVVLLCEIKTRAEWIRLVYFIRCYIWSIIVTFGSKLNFSGLSVTAEDSWY